MNKQQKTSRKEKGFFFVENVIICKKRRKKKKKKTLIEQRSPAFLRPHHHPIRVLPIRVIGKIEYNTINKLFP